MEPCRRWRKYVDQLAAFGTSSGSSCSWDIRVWSLASCANPHQPRTQQIPAISFCSTNCEASARALAVDWNNLILIWLARVNFYCYSLWMNVEVNRRNWGAWRHNFLRFLGQRTNIFNRECRQLIATSNRRVFNLLIALITRRWILTARYIFFYFL